MPIFAAVFRHVVFRMETAAENASLAQLARARDL